MNRHGFLPCPICKSDAVVFPLYELAVVRVHCGGCSTSSPFQATLDAARELWNTIARALAHG